MRILIFSLENEDLILKSLRSSFPSIGFRKCKANEDIDDEGKKLIIVDTIPGVRKAILIDSLDSGWLKGEASHAVSMLRILKNLGSIDSVRVIAVPDNYPPALAIKEIIAIMRQM